MHMNFDFASYFAVYIAFALILSFFPIIISYAYLRTWIIMCEEEILEIFCEYSDKMFFFRISEKKNLKVEKPY